MSLLGNHSLLNKNPLDYIGTVGAATTRSSIHSYQTRIGRFEDGDEKSSFPEGYGLAGWLISKASGGVASRNDIAGTGALAASGAMGKNAEAALTGTGSMDGVGALVVAAIAALSGSGTLAGALNATLAASAALSGTGAMSGDVGALGGVTAALMGTGTLTAGSYATGTLAADILPYTELSPQSLAAAVWSALAASSNDAGSMGEKLNDAGSAANPWTEVIETGLTAAQAMRLITAALAGKISGAAGTTVTIKNAVADDASRIVATVDADGNRTAITYDLD